MGPMHDDDDDLDPQFTGIYTVVVELGQILRGGALMLTATLFAEPIARYVWSFLQYAIPQ